VRPILSGHPGVIGVGVGVSERHGLPTDQVAFVITVMHDVEQSALEHLPREVLGIPVDVQKSAIPTLKSIAGGQAVQQPGQPPPGRLGCLVQDAAGQVYALTAMHALVHEHDTEIFRFANGPFFDVEVNSGNGFNVAGRLQAGEFTRHSDIACVKLTGGSAWERGLGGTSTILTTPADPWTVSSSAGISLVVPPHGVVLGSVAQFPYDGSFATDAGVLQFQNLMKFRVATPHGIPGGWSGSTLFRSSTREPLALLSFGSDSSDAAGVAFAYGFPLFIHYAAWNLRPV
jgi:hypothetical protein